MKCQARRAVPLEKKPNPPSNLMRNKKLRATLSEWVLAIFLLTEILITNVCSRLVKKIRLRDGSTSNSTGLLTKDWDLDILNKERAEFKDDLRAASGINH